MLSRSASLGWYVRSMLGVPGLPLRVSVAAAHPRMRVDLRERLGIKVPPIVPGAIWIHGSSVGEVRATLSLIKDLEGPILLTSDTDTGTAVARELARKAGPLVQACARPIDHWFTIAPIWAAAQPRGLIFIEGAWWPQLAGMAERCGVPVIRVSAKAGPRTRRFARSWWYSRWTRSASLVVARDHDEALWFKNHSDARVEVGGNLKYAVGERKSPFSWSRPFIVFGSIRQAEEEYVCSCVEHLFRSHSILVAPRYVERAPYIVERLRGVGIPVRLRSTVSESPVDREAAVVVLDSIGELAACYDGAHACFVGGTLERSCGGHSPIEAQISGTPIVCGPHTFGQGSAFADAGAVVTSSIQETVDALMTAAPCVPVSDVSDAARLVRKSVRTKESKAVSPRPWAAPLVVPWLIGGFLRGRLPGMAGAQAFSDIPVVCVGSANARGPGKSSVALWFARTLREQGHTVGILGHGYGVKSSRSGLVSGVADASWAGDEAAIMAHYGFLVAVSRPREGGIAILRRSGATVIVMDDGLQQSRIRSDVRINVVDDRCPEAHGVIPVGYRRTWSHRPPNTSGDVHINGRKLGTYGTYSWGPWFYGESLQEPPLDRPWFAFSGIARHGDFISGLTQPLIGHLELSDHRAPSDAEWQDIVRSAAGCPIVCTVKDWVKLQPTQRSQVYWRDRFVTVQNPNPGWFHFPPRS